ALRLRIFLETLFQFAQRLTGRVHDPQNLERANDAVAGGCKIADDYVHALFPTDIDISANHFFNHVAIAHFCANDFAAVGCERFVQAEITHHGRDQRVVAKLVRFQKIERGDGENFVAINDLAIFIAKQNAVGIAIVSDTDIGVNQAHDALNFIRMSAAAAVVNVDPVGLVVGAGDVSAELAQNARRRFVGGAIRDIDGDAYFFERHFSGETRLREFDVAPKGIINARSPSDFSGGRPDVVDLAAKDQVLDLRFDLIVEFVAVVPKKFNAVVFVRIVGSGKNYAGIGSKRSSDVSHARRWQRTDDEDINAERGDPGDERVLEHVT